MRKSKQSKPSTFNVESSTGAKRSGFTIVEILIAMVVLSLGLMGILGVFPAGIRMTSGIVEDSNAAIIAESVRNAVELGLSRARIDDSGRRGFVYLGEGVTALLEESGHTLPIDITTLDGNGSDINTAADYWVKLPPPDGSEYLYPRSDPTTYDMGPLTGQNLPPTKRVFPCGAQIAKDARDPALTAVEREEADKDPFPQYSYAFVIKEAKVGDPPVYTANHSLYELTIHIYRNFPINLFRQGNESAGFASERHQPIETFKTYVKF
jgi:prepilin-type N-terminal cleavage/methylation domain-containing protein